MNPPGPSRFATTRWTLVVRSRPGGDDSSAALAELCEAYYAPVQAFIRASVRDPETARDLTQEFFARMLRGGALERAEPARGRFRSFLLGAVKHFLADMRDRERAVKRGSGVDAIPLESATDTSPGSDLADPRSGSSDAIFDREWAISLLDRALQTLDRELAASGKEQQFAVLKPWLTGAAPISQAEAAERLAINETALKVAIHRLRKRFREIVKREIAETVTGADEQQAELRHLITAIALADPGIPE